MHLDGKGVPRAQDDNPWPARFFQLPKILVNRQKLHDWGYLTASKGEILLANMAELPFAT
jgi:hypothetical protein